MPIYLANSGLSQSVKKAYTVVNGVTVPLGSAYRIEDGKTSENMLNTFNGVIYDNGKEYIPLKFTSTINLNKSNYYWRDTYPSGDDNPSRLLTKLKETNDIYLKVISSNGSYWTTATVYTSQKLDLSKYTKLNINYDYHWTEMNGIIMSAYDKVFEGYAPSSTSKTCSQSTSTKWSNATQTLSNISVNYKEGYIGITLYIKASAEKYNEIKIKKIWLE